MSRITFGDIYFEYLNFQFTVNKFTCSHRNHPVILLYFKMTSTYCKCMQLLMSDTRKQFCLSAMMSVKDVTDKPHKIYLKEQNVIYVDHSIS